MSNPSTHWCQSWGLPGGTTPGTPCPERFQCAPPARRSGETEARRLRGRGGVHPLRPPGPAGPAPAPPAAFPPPRTLLRRESVSCRCRRPHSALAPGERPQADMGPRSVPLLPLLLALLGRPGEWGREAPGNRTPGMRAAGWDSGTGARGRELRDGTATAGQRGDSGSVAKGVPAVPTQAVIVTPANPPGEEV